MSALGWLLIALLVTALLTAAAFAIRSVSRIWLRHWVEQRLSGFEMAETYLERPQRLLVAAASATALCLVLAGVLLGLLYGGRVELLVAAVVVYALLALIVGRLVPRAIARRWASHLIPVLAPTLTAVGILMAPLVALARVLSRPFARQTVAEPESRPHEEIEDLLREGELEGVGEHDEIAIITGVVHFGEKVLSDVMTPRADIFALDAATPPRQLALRIAQSAYSRIPIYRGTLDQIIGMVLAFDVIKHGAERVPPLRAVAFAPPGKRCTEQLFEMLRKRLHLAIVRDDVGRSLGLVTLEDLLEELVGDIRDEHDEPQPPHAAAAP